VQPRAGDSRVFDFLKDAKEMMGAWWAIASFSQSALKKYSSSNYNTLVDLDA
jgi:hypothetical protein